MIPVCVYPPHQERQARALKEYCLDLDGTVVHLIEFSQKQHEETPVQFPLNRFHCLQAHALRKAAIHVGTDFVWLEADSVPLRPRWLARLHQEYWRAKEMGKKFLLSSDSNPPHDMIGGIGCYPPETRWLVPTDHEHGSWDGWMIRCIPHLIFRSPLVQHSYGIYGEDGFVKHEHRFPRDSSMLRPNALIFHRDKHQDLLSLQSC
jgi:hypothetical protein